MSSTYTTHGPVRACCGHNHKTIESAARCLRKDIKGCKSVGGYSDRVILIVEHVTRGLSHAERDSVSHILDV